MRIILIFLFFIKILFAVDVLILNSYSVQFPWTKGEVEGILKNLKNRNLKIYIEFMDTKIFKPTPEYLKNFYNYLKIKYNNIPLNIVITTDDNALNFVIKHKKDFFKNSKVFFAGVNNLKIAKILNREDFTGVFEKKEPLKNLNFAKKTVKNLKYIYLVADNSVSAKSVMHEYKIAFKNIKKYKFIYINNSNLKEILKKIKNAPENSVMLLLTPFSFRINNHHINYKKAIKLISENFQNPIIIHTDMLSSLKNCNIIGGKVTDAISQGEEVSKKVLEYIQGKKMKNINLTYEKANKMYLNVKNLKKFGIDPYSLGYKNAIFVNKSESVFEKYKYWIVCLTILFFIMLSFIIVLYMKNKKLQKSDNYSINIDEEIKKKILNDEEIKKAKIYAYERYFIIVLDIIKRNIYDILKNKGIKSENLLKQISFFQNSLFEKEIKNAKEYILEIIKTFNISSKEVEIKGDETLLKINPLVLSQVIFFVLENCDKIKIYIMKNELKIVLKRCEITLNEINEYLSVTKINIDLEKNNEDLIISLKNEDKFSII